jgi:hypothetical protein
MINDRLAEALNRFEEDLIAGAIISVSDEAFRVRRLPIWGLLNKSDKYN